MKINTYAVNCNDAWLNTEGDDISGSYVQYKDHQALVAELEAKCAAMAAEVQAVRWACGQVYAKGYNHGHLNTADGLDYASESALVERGGEVLADFIDPDHCGVAADSILDEVRAQGVDSAAGTLMVHMNHQHVAVAEALHILRTHATQLRQDANTAELVAAGIITRIED